MLLLEAGQREDNSNAAIENWTERGQLQCCYWKLDRESTTLILLLKAGQRKDNSNAAIGSWTEREQLQCCY